MLFTFTLVILTLRLCLWATWGARLLHFWNTGYHTPTFSDYKKPMQILYVRLTVNVTIIIYSFTIIFLRRNIKTMFVYFYSEGTNFYRTAAITVFIF